MRVYEPVRNTTEETQKAYRGRDMTQPHGLRWMLEEKQARFEAASAGNIGALLSVRDHGVNAMACVHACKTIETMLDNVSERLWPASERGFGWRPHTRPSPQRQLVERPEHCRYRRARELRHLRQTGRRRGVARRL
jgi:hypothetical protein